MAFVPDSLLVRHDLYAASYACLSCQEIEKIKDLLVGERPLVCITDHPEFPNAPWIQPSLW